MLINLTYNIYFLHALLLSFMPLLLFCASPYINDMLLQHDLLIRPFGREWKVLD